MTGTESETTEEINIGLERAEAAKTIIEELKKNGVPHHIAHDLLNGYRESLEGYFKEGNYSPCGIRCVVGGGSRQ